MVIYLDTSAWLKLLIKEEAHEFVGEADHVRLPEVYFV